MSFTDGSSNSEWKETKVKTEKFIKQEYNTGMSKPKYSQKFVDKWLTVFHPWLARDEYDSNKPFCRACQCRLDCNRCHLQRHERTTKHARNLDILINKGEGAARQNLSLRQERSKYYQKRKMNSSVASSHDASDLGMDTAEDFIEETDADAETPFHFVQTEPPNEQYTEETILKQEAASADNHGHGHGHGHSHGHSHVHGHSGEEGDVDHDSTRSHVKDNHSLRAAKVKKIGVKKERMKLLMQIQKDKNDLLESFKELMGGSFAQQAPPKEKNHVDLFFESVSTSVKALSPKLIAESKMRVSQLICELELRALTETEAANNAATANAASGATVVVSQEAGSLDGGTYIINQPVATVVQHTGNTHHDDDVQHYRALS